jgi:hypothetical protein
LEVVLMAVGEVCAMLLARAVRGVLLIARYELGDDRIVVQVSADAVNPSLPDTDSFAWQVLNTAAREVRAEAGDDVLSITMAVTSTTSSTRA